MLTDGRTLTPPWKLWKRKQGTFYRVCYVSNSFLHAVIKTSLILTINSSTQPPHLQTFHQSCLKNWTSHSHFSFACVCVRAQLLLSCPILWDPMDCSSSVHGILQARIQERVAISFSRGIFQTQGLNLGLLHCRYILCRWATRETLSFAYQQITNLRNRKLWSDNHTCIFRKYLFTKLILTVFFWRPYSNTYYSIGSPPYTWSSWIVLLMYITDTNAYIHK